MKELSIADKGKVWKKARVLKTLEPHSEQAKKIQQEVIEFCAINVDDLRDWQINKSKTNVALLIKHVDQVNKLIKDLLMVESKVLTAGELLNNNFEKAEKAAKEAIRFASGNPKLFDVYEKEVADYYASDESKTILARKRKGEKIDHPQSIQDKEAYMKKSKDVVNAIANSLMIYAPEFRKQRELNMMEFLKKEYGAQFASRDGQIQYRVVRPFGEYGIPETAFKEGLSPQFVSVWSFQRGIISKPYINDISVFTGEKVGWTGGIASTSANLKFTSAYDFAASYGQQDGWIYAYATDKAASVAHHITYGVGYDGIVNTRTGLERSNAEAAMEYMVTFMAPENIVAARKVTKDGKLRELEFNPEVKRSAFGDVEYLKFLLCESVDELRLLEFLEMKSPEIKDKIAEELYIKRMVNTFKALPIERQAILLKLAYAATHTLHAKLSKDLATGLKDEQPEKWRHLENMAEHLNVPSQVISVLEERQQIRVKRKLEETSDVKISSHFGYEFERDKRVKSKDPITKPTNVQRRYELAKEKQTKITPIQDDTDEKGLSKIKPKNRNNP